MKICHSFKERRFNDDELRRLLGITGAPRPPRRLSNVGAHQRTVSRTLARYQALPYVGAKALAAASFYTGVRKGELTKVNWDQVDFEVGVITLYETKNDETRVLARGAASSTGCIGAGRVPSLYGRHFMSGPRTPSASRLGAKAYFEQPRNTVVRALAFKWIRILFRCWKDRKPYSEDVYRQALVRRQKLTGKSSPLQLQWKTCAGFSKIAAITS